MKGSYVPDISLSNIIQLGSFGILAWLIWVAVEVAPKIITRFFDELKIEREFYRSELQIDRDNFNESMKQISTSINRQSDVVANLTVAVTSLKDSLKSNCQVDTEHNTKI